MLDCLHALEAPGLPVEYRFQTKSGELTFRAQSYSFAPARGSLYITAPVLTDSGGNLIASLDSVEVTGLNLLRAGAQILRIHGVNFRGRLTRLKDGHFDLQDYLPEHQNAASVLPFDVVIDRAQIQLVDATGSAPWSRTVTTPLVKVVGLGTDWVATASGRISNTGSADVRIQKIRDVGLQVAGATQSLELAPILDHLRQTPAGRKMQALQSASCSSLVVRGPFVVFIPAGKSAALETTLVASAKQVRYGKYSAAAARFTGRVTAEGMVGDLEVTDGATMAKFKGSAVWEHGVRAGGEVTVSVPNSISLPPWTSSLVPKNASFSQGSFHGWISVATPETYHVSGTATAESVQAAGEHFNGLNVSLEAENDRVVVQVDHGSYAGQPISGIVTVNPKLRTLEGTASAEGIDLTKVGARFGFKQVEGDATVSAMVTGTLYKPSVSFLTHGQGVITVLKGHTLSLGDFEATGRYSAGDLQLDRAYFDTPEGLIAAHGSLGHAGSLGMDVTGRGVLLAAYDPNLSGEANLVARVTGTLRNPLATGRIEGYDLTYKSKSIPAAVADFKADRNHIEVDDLQAARGTSNLSGSGALLFKGSLLSGSLAAHDIQVADWLGDEFVGAVDMPRLDLSGTLSHPKAVATVEGTSLVTRGIKLDSLAANLQLDGNLVELTGLKVVGADGMVSALGSYDIDDQSGTASMTASSLSLEKLLPELDSTVVLKGAVSGQASVRVAGGHLVGGDASGKVSEVVINGSPVGNGDWRVHSDGSAFSGAGEIGDATSYIKLTDATYDPSTKKAAAQIHAVKVKATNIVATLLPSLNLSPDLMSTVQSVDGLVSVDGSFDGTMQEPHLKVDDITLSDLTYHRQPAGQIDASFELSQHKWTVQSLTVSKGPANLSIHGTIDEKGETHLDALQDNRFDLAALSVFDARMSRMTGVADLWFSVDGPTRSPKIVASLSVRNLFAPPEVAVVEGEEDKYLRLNLDKIVVDPASTVGPAIQAAGEYFYKGFGGSISVDAPFEYPDGSGHSFRFPNDKPVTGSVTFDKTDLKNIAPYVGGLDAKRTAGTLEGAVQVSGTPDNPQLSGAVTLEAGSLAFNGVDEVLKNAKASLGLAPGKVSIAATGEPRGGGSLVASASVPLEELSVLLSNFRASGPDSLLDRALTGHVSVKNTDVKQKIFEQTSFAGRVGSEINLGGTLRRPAITGDVTLANGDIVLGGLPTETSTTEDRTIDPSFDVNLKLNGPTRLRSSTADMYLIGDGTLKGSLQYPKVDAALTVEKGSVRLPAALLRVQQGGSVRVDYGVTSPRAASAIVDLEATTAVTASKYGDSDVQRYDITLTMSGDLLQEKGLTLYAVSDPPDLTQERIMEILGEADLLQTFSNGGTSTALQQALLSAVPGLLDPYTGVVARGLGLDYINLEYNTFDLASLAFGKILGWGFSIEGSHQLSEPPPGLPYRYDLRIVYRPRKLPGALHQIRLYFGADQDNPWKAGLDYGVRFK